MQEGSVQCPIYFIHGNWAMMEEANTKGFVQKTLAGVLGKNLTEFFFFFLWCHRLGSRQSGRKKENEDRDFITGV